MKILPPPIYVWILDPQSYNARIMAVSEAGLRERVSSALKASHRFENESRPTICGVADDFAGHLRRAFDSRRLLNLSALGAWRLFEKRNLVVPVDGKPTVDILTIGALDTACAHYLRCTILNRETLLQDGWPGLSEWFVHSEEEPPVVLPSVHGAVSAFLRRQLWFNLQLSDDDYAALHVLGPVGRPIKILGSGEPCGTFLVQAKARTEDRVVGSSGPS